MTYVQSGLVFILLSCISLAVPSAYMFAQAAGEKGMSIGCCATYYTSSQFTTIVNDMQALGVIWIRIDVPWDIIQPTNASTYSWSAMDAAIQIILAHGMKPLLIVGGQPSWVNTTSWNSTTDPATFPGAYGVYAGELAKHYSAMGVHYFELWNEPNTGNWPGGTPDAHHYTQILKAGYTTIKANDPSAFVLSGGLAGGLDSLPFLTTMYADGAKNYFDALSDHSYSFPDLPAVYQPWNPWSIMSLTSPSIRSIMTDNGDADKKVWITEFGAPTAGTDRQSVSEAIQAQMVTDSFTILKSYSWAGPLMWYSYQDRGTDTNTVENFFGLLRFDGSHKPAYDVFKSVAGDTTITPTTGPCTQAYTNSVAVPAGYGAAYDVFTPSVILVQADCVSATPLLKVGGTNQNQYIYKIGYAYKGGAWQQINLQGLGALISSNWYAGSAQGTLPFTATDLANWNYIVGYVCTWSGSAWKCGCADAACAAGNWELQSIKR